MGYLVAYVLGQVSLYFLLKKLNCLKKRGEDEKEVSELQR